MPDKHPDLESFVLDLVADPTQSFRNVGPAQQEIPKLARSHFGDLPGIGHGEVAAAIWALVSRGLLYISFSSDNPLNWGLDLTAAGKAAAKDEDYNPDLPDRYVVRLRETVPDLTETVMTYVNEAVNAYLNRCYLASAIMLGVASEAAFLELGAAFAKWLPQSDCVGFGKVFDSRRATYDSKFHEFRKRLEPRIALLPFELSDGLPVALVAVLDLLRITRNEAGHPTGRVVQRHDQHTNLQMFARYVERMYELRRFFLDHPLPREG